MSPANLDESRDPEGRLAPVAPAGLRAVVAQLVVDLPREDARIVAEASCQGAHDADRGAAVARVVLAGVLAVSVLLRGSVGPDLVDVRISRVQPGRIGRGRSAQDEGHSPLGEDIHGLREEGEVVSPLPRAQGSPRRTRPCALRSLRTGPYVSIDRPAIARPLLEVVRYANPHRKPFSLSP